ncbi:hypothetical protein GPUN_2730 [Glaciecola punicea ACAM 611]|uniref:Uncharacterized protein n=1 Tax=Glaciecola punicea ACAM 611 TaxID=1121923 RepID=H5TER7_9ALTE|nr:hypothetical protein GPUN_2730 [Glaciecola punicea ACAM 611]
MSNWATKLFIYFAVASTIVYVLGKIKIVKTTQSVANLHTLAFSLKP